MSRANLQMDGPLQQLVSDALISEQCIKIGGVGGELPVACLSEFTKSTLVNLKS